MTEVTEAARLLLTPPEAAKQLAISPSTLARLTRTGQIPAVKFLRTVRYRPTDLVAWIAKTLADASDD